MSGQRVFEFDTFREGYGGCEVTVLIAGTTTLADIFSDILCTVPLDNPQTLETRVLDDLHSPFGRWVQPIYTESGYELSISNGERTGLQIPPLTVLDGADASLAVVTPRHGEVEVPLTDWIERTIYVENYGVFSADNDALNNSQTLETAIGVAAAQGGGYVYLPAGLIPINPITLPEGVVLVGARTSATTLLVQTTDAAAITIGGDGAGLHDIIIDGVSVPSGSYGVDALGKNAIEFERVLIRRFDTGVRMRGGEGNRWNTFSVASCNAGLLLSGDLDAATEGAGAAFRSLVWQGGAVAFNVTTGLELKSVDAVCSNIDILGVQFEANLGTTLKITGARDVRFRSCWWHSNPISLDVGDNLDAPDSSINTVSRIEFTGGYFDGAAIDTTLTFAGECDAVRFHLVEFFGNADFALTAPEHIIHQDDCRTSAGTTVSGLTQFLFRHSTDDGGYITGVSSGAVTVVAWTETVPPGESWICDARVVAKRTNGIERGSWWVTGTIQRPAATLAYHSLATAFTVGAIVTGAASGASARIVADSAGTLTLIDITGTFVTNEVIDDTNGGSARVSGSLSTTGTVLSGSGNQSLKTADESFTGTPTVLFAPNGANGELQLTGVASADITWTVELHVMKS